MRTRHKKLTDVELYSQPHLNNILIYDVDSKPIDVFGTIYGAKPVICGHHIEIQGLAKCGTGGELERVVIVIKAEGYPDAK